MLPESVYVEQMDAIIVAGFPCCRQRASLVAQPKNRMKTNSPFRF